MAEEKTAPITIQDVDQVAKSLLSNGEEVSVRKVRAELGRGSFTTIRQLIDDWKALQVELKLPDSLTSEINKLYLDIWQKAVKDTEDANNLKTLEIIETSRKTEAALHEAEKEIEKLEAILSDYQNNSVKLEKKIKRISKKSSNLSEEVDRLRKSNAVLQEKYDFMQRTFTKKLPEASSNNLTNMIQMWSQKTDTKIDSLDENKKKPVVTRHKASTTTVKA